MATLKRDNGLSEDEKVQTDFFSSDLFFDILSSRCFASKPET